MATPQKLPNQFPFEKLTVWQDARDLSRGIHQLTQNFPKPEAQELTTQLNKAILSVATNLAEGTARNNPKEQAHFSQLAYSSLLETSCLLILATDMQYLTEQQYADLRPTLQMVSARIQNLRRSQIERQAQAQGISS